MKRLIILGLCTSLTTLIMAQQPVSWSYSSKKVNDKTYEVHIHAVIDPGWHIYAHSQPAGAIGKPTTIGFVHNPLLALVGKVRERGQLEKHKIEVLDVTQYQYEKEVDFVQKVKRRGDDKTALTGTVIFQVCTDEQCLMPQELPFTVPIQ